MIKVPGGAGTGAEGTPFAPSASGNNGSVRVDLTGYRTAEEQDELDLQSATRQQAIDEQQNKRIKSLEEREIVSKNQPLTFTGAVAATYDGSEETCVRIPAGGITLLDQGNGRVKIIGDNDIETGEVLKIVDLDIVNNTATATGAEIVAHIDAGGIVLGRILDNIFALPICMGNDVFFEWRYPGECDVFYTTSLSAESTAITNLPSEVGHVRTMDIVDNLTTDNAKKPLSAAQGVILKQAIDDVAAAGTGETASGAGKSWELLNTVTLEEDSNSVIINQDSDGEAFEVDAFAFYVDAVSSDLQTDSSTVYVGATASGYIGQIQNVSATSARVWGCYEFLTERMLRTAGGTAASGTPTVSISYAGSYPLSAQMVRIYGYYFGAGSVVYLYGRKK